MEKSFYVISKSVFDENHIYSENELDEEMIAVVKGDDIEAVKNCVNKELTAAVGRIRAHYRNLHDNCVKSCNEFLKLITSGENNISYEEFEEVSEKAKELENLEPTIRGDFAGELPVHMFVADEVEDYHVHVLVQSVPLYEKASE